MQQERQGQLAGLTAADAGPGLWHFDLAGFVGPARFGAAREVVLFSTAPFAGEMFSLPLKLAAAERHIARPSSLL